MNIGWYRMGPRVTVIRHPKLTSIKSAERKQICWLCAAAGLWPPPGSYLQHPWNSRWRKADPHRPVGVLQLCKQALWDHRTSRSARYKRADQTQASSYLVNVHKAQQMHIQLVFKVAIPAQAPWVVTFWLTPELNDKWLERKTFIFYMFQ